MDRHTVPIPGLLVKLIARPDALPHELESGNFEYKLQLIDKGPQLFRRLVTQLKWRLAEGQGEAVNGIGIADDGKLVGLTSLDLGASLGTLRAMAAAAGADCTRVSSKYIAPGALIAEVTVHERIREDTFLDVRVGLFGPSEAVKAL